MTLDPVRLQHVLFLATGEPMSPHEVGKLADLLSIREEVLPYILLRRGGFRNRPEILDAISAAKGASPGRVSRPDAPQRANAIRIKAAEMDLAAIIKSMIDRDLGAADEHAGFDNARRALVNQLPAQAGDAHSRIHR